MARRKKLRNMTQEEIASLTRDEFSRALADDTIERAEKAGKLAELFAILDKIPDDLRDRRGRKIK